ncbi:MAG: hypothetical protein JXA33_11485 [Anaerolineae bacterium]|nr:hypothetical protein [Anaerolineae bacterium]
MSKYSEVIILCEDRQQEVFARHFLVNCGICRRRIRIHIAPKGMVSGEHYVRTRYPVEVRSYRARSPNLNIALVVLIDSDLCRIEERRRQLEQSLVEHNLQMLQSVEKIGVFIPRRNIETWIHYLQGENVNEIEIYAKFQNEGICKPLVAELARTRHQLLPDDAPASLQAACSELERIL